MEIAPDLQYLTGGKMREDVHQTTEIEAKIERLNISAFANSALAPPSLSRSANLSSGSGPHPTLVLATPLANPTVLIILSLCRVVAPVLYTTKLKLSIMRRTCYMRIVLDTPAL